MLTTGRADADHFHEECGVFGIWGHPEAAALTALGLHALQHRGQEAAGIVTFDGQQFCVERHIGLVGDNFTRPSVMERLKGDRAIGHNRYSTAGGAPVLTSETCALDIIGASLVREVAPGELLVVTDDSIQSLKPFAPHRSRFCIFEHVYFARPDSIVAGTSVYEVRKRIGAELAR